MDVPTLFRPQRLSCNPSSLPSRPACRVHCRCLFVLRYFSGSPLEMCPRLATQGVRSFICFNSCARSQNLLTKRALTTALNTQRCRRRASNKGESEFSIRPKQVVCIFVPLRYIGVLNNSLVCSEDFTLPHHTMPQKTRMLS